MQPNLQPQADPLAEAIARRGQGNQAPMMAQGGAPAPAPMPPMPAPQAPQGPAAPVKFEPANKEDFIITTLAEELKRSHDLKKEELKFNSPQQGMM